MTLWGCRRADDQPVDRSDQRNIDLRLDGRSCRHGQCVRRDCHSRDPATFVWTVTNVNRPPVVTNPGNQSSAAGAASVLPIIASDLDLETLTYSASGLPQGLSISSATGVISGTIAFTAAASNTVIVTASDGLASDSKTFTWNVTTRNVTGTNRPPTCVATATPSVIWPPNHQTVYLSLTGVIDPDGGALTIRYTGILQDEPTDSAGQGNTMQDGGIEDNGARVWVRCRAERQPRRTGDGRVYLVSFTATDAGDLSCTGHGRASVPHDQTWRAGRAQPRPLELDHRPAGVWIPSARRG